MKTLERIIIYLLLAIALAGICTAHARITRMDDEMHRHLALLNAGHYFQSQQIDSLRGGK